jgi:transposase
MDGEAINQEEAARILGVCDWTFRRYIHRYEEMGLDGLLNKRLAQVSSRPAPVDEVIALARQYEGRYRGWSVQHFHSWYQRDGGQRSYTWVKNTLQSRGLVFKVARKDTRRKRRYTSPLPGMMLHQDGSTHEWVPGKKWNLIVTMDDTTGEHYRMFFVQEEGAASNFQGVRDVILHRGLFSSLYTNRGSHYWFTPECGGKVRKGSWRSLGVPCGSWGSR